MGERVGVAALWWRLGLVGLVRLATQMVQILRVVVDVANVSGGHMVGPL